MNVLELRNLIANMPDDADVIIWVHDRAEPDEAEAVSVHEAFLTGHPGHDPTMARAVHLAVLI